MAELRSYCQGSEHLSSPLAWICFRGLCWILFQVAIFLQCRVGRDQAVGWGPHLAYQELRIKRAYFWIGGVVKHMTSLDHGAVFVLSFQQGQFWQPASTRFRENI